MRQSGLMGLVLGVTTVAPVAALAQAGWDTFDNAATGDRGAFVCPMDDPEVTGNFFCIMLACRGSGPLSLIVAFAGGPAAVPTARAVFTVDGLEQAPVTLLQADDEEFAYRQPVTALMGDLVARLKAGSRAAISLYDGGDLMTDFAFSLRGSSAAISHAEAICPVVEVAPAGQPEPQAATASKTWSSSMVLPNAARRRRFIAARPGAKRNSGSAVPPAPIFPCCVATCTAGPSKAQVASA
jgi:hypothetical protein